VNLFGVPNGEVGEKASVQDTKAAKAALERSFGIISLNCREGFACLDGLSV
jgi:hypothetical protein